MLRRVIVLGLCGLPLAAKKKKRKKGKESEFLGLLSGTVFDSNGQSLPGARVTATAEDDPELEIQAVSDPRGEFALRTPAFEDPSKARTYALRAERKGFLAAEKTADAYYGQKTNLNFLLSPE
jgi:hypothetical protein